MQIVNIGIIGAGNIARTFAGAGDYVENAKITAVASRSLEKAQNFANEHNIEKAYGSYQEILDDKNIDAIYVATPHNTHYEVTKLALNNGKSVICEKPFVLKKEHCTELVELAKSKGLTLMEAMWTRFLPCVTQAHKWIEEGKIGETRIIEANFSFSAKVNPQGRLFNKSLAGGALFDVGVYTLEFAMDFAGAKMKDYKVFARYGETGVDENTSVNILFENNVLASLNCGIRTAMKNDAYIYGTQGHILIENFYNAKNVKLYKNGGELLEEVSFENDTNAKGFKYEIEHFANLVINKESESPRIPFEQVLQSCEIYENI